MIEIFPLIRLSKVILVVLDLSQDGVGMSKAVSVYEFSIQVFCFTLVSYVLGNHKIVPKSSKNKVEELYTEHRNSRLPTWFCCFGCKHAAEYPKTFFYIYSENSTNPTCYSKALRCTFFEKRKKSCSSKFVQILLLNRVKAR